MRNSEVYAYIERMFDAISSGLPDGDVIDEVTNVIMDLEEEVVKQMEAEEEKKSGFNSTSFFNDLADSTYDEIIEVSERMDEVHPSLSKFMQYLMEEDDPTFFIAYGDEPLLTGRSSDEWGYETSALIFNHFLSNMKRSDSDDK